MNSYSRRFLPDIAAGVIIAFFVLALAGSYSLLFFPGSLAEFSGWGVRIALTSAFFVGIWTSLKGCFPATISIPQDRVAPIFGVTSASLVAAMSSRAAPAAIASTLIVTIAAAALLTGALLFFLGRFKLANLTRYIPYPVVCGFLAGSGWLLVIGSVTVVTGEHVRAETIASLFTSSKMVPWLPCAAFGIVLYLVQLRVSHWTFFLSFIALCAGGFYLYLGVRGISVDDARAAGWLIPRMAQFGDSDLHLGAILRLADWRELLHQGGTFTAVAITSLVSILLNSSAIEIDTGQEMDLNQELSAAGVGNLLAGFFGGMPGFSSLSLTRLGRHVGARTRVAGVTVAVVCGGFMLFHPQIVGYIPKFLLGGLLLYLGLHFLDEWVIRSWTRVPRLDYAAILVILVVIATTGYIQGVIAGLLIATIQFVVNYSRIHVVSQALSGAQQQSNVDRPLAQQKLLRTLGGRIYILKLQGFIFFGSASKFLADIQHRMQDPEMERLEFVVLDFRRVHGLDSSAVLALRKLLQRAEAFDFILLFCSVAPEIRSQIEAAGFSLIFGDRFELHHDRDHALEWCENRLLQEQSGVGSHQGGLREQIQVYWPAGGVDFDGLMPYLERREIAVGEYLMRQGESADELYFIESGRVTVHLVLQNGTSARLRTMNSGTVVGELGMYLGEARTASIVADERCGVWRLSRANLDRLQREDSDLASAFHLFMVRLLADRLVNTGKILQAVLE